MIRLKEAIVVEGRYDKIKLGGIVDAPIIETGGFRVFNDREKLQLIRSIAAARGIVLLTDSDGAGFVIRNFLKGAVPKEQISNCYIPQLPGKEKRKAQAGKEGLLGVEGVGTANAAKLRQALLRRLGLPTYLSANAMLTALNCLYSLEELKDLLDSMENK